ncbi:MAG: 1-acyl-sn-glycerol-3-phosphate acyltransferase [Synergistaceae bacterium]|nr:1-acyl-sn-glycerol-3-phosphate acyltransferase [Synergistaceae bacterium]
MFNRIFYKLTQSFFWIIFKIYNRMTVKWEAELPERDRYIVTANHCSNLDPLLIGVNFPKQLRYLAKNELFRSFLFGKVIRILGAVPVLQEDSNAAASTLKGFLNLLKNGESVILFPEGSRSPDGKLKPLEGGTALISLKTGVPIIPAYISGSFEAMPAGAAWVKPKKIRIVFGKALYPPDAGEKSSKEARDVLTQTLTNALSEMENKYGK